MSRAEVDLQISVKKACNTEEVPPKRKHVRACIVYTWDHKNSRAFWNAVKIQPLQNSEVQLFKALIMIHKVLQEGHPNALKDGYRNRDFLYSLSTVYPNSSSYGRLINQYDRFLLRKLDFHRNNPGFNGTFEYEEYISLRTVNDPNEGYESILQLMDLQDMIQDLQQLIFATVHQHPGNLCKISALVPLVSETYGIYKFLISMLRAMYQQLGDDDALAALFDRFNSQHYSLRDFYTDCQAIKFLTSLITIPKLNGVPPNLKIVDEQTPRRQASPEAPKPHIEQQPTQFSFERPAEVPYKEIDNHEADFQAQQQLQQQQQQELELQRQRQLQDQFMMQQQFEQQKLDQERRNIQEQEMLRMQQTNAQTSRVAELEHDLVMFKNQFDNDQTLLQQYDSRVKSLEMELANINETASQQLASKDEQVKLLEEQVTNWAKKYEALAKLYSQLRLEHLNLLSKFKKIQQKINSAQESILKKEKFEKDLKQKNLELADLIRERDRARLDLDRVKASKDVEIERLQTELRALSAEYSESDKSKTKELSTLLKKHESELENLRLQLTEKDKQLASLDVRNLQDQLKEKEVDLEIAQESLDSALKELSLSKKPSSSTTSSQIWELLDIVLVNNVRRVQDTKFEFTSAMQAGNLNSSPEYAGSIVDLCADTATEFAQAFNNFLAESSDEGVIAEGSALSGVILSGSELSTSLHDLMLNIKGLSKTIASDEESRWSQILETVLSKAEIFYLSLTSDLLQSLDQEDDKIDLVIDCNIQLQQLLKELGDVLETFKPKTSFNLKENIEKQIDAEFDDAVKTIKDASLFLNLLKNKSSSSLSLEVHEAIVSAALRITNAVAALIEASIDSQREIVKKNRGTLSIQEFYKKNNRWTEGLISASKAVAGATNILILTADGVLNRAHSHEELIVACNEVAASTAQLVAASRVKANFMSPTQDTLEGSSSTVNSACKQLVARVQELMSRNDEQDAGQLDLSTLTPYEGKTLEMEQQVEILKLENSLASARKRLADIRKQGYKDDVSDEEEWCHKGMFVNTIIKH